MKLRTASNCCFLPNTLTNRRIHTRSFNESNVSKTVNNNDRSNRREMLFYSSMLALSSMPLLVSPVSAEDLAEMEALKGKDYGKPRMSYKDFVKSDSGLQYKDLAPGTGTEIKSGDEVLVDWDGYTIGYYGRPFEARNKAKGGAFVGDDKEFLKVKVGDHSVIPAFEEALIGMKTGGVRRIVVPVSIGYPDNSFRKIGPKPTTFSGQRALSFVLNNQGLIDKTLLFDIEIIKIYS